MSILVEFVDLEAASFDFLQVASKDGLELTLVVGVIATVTSSAWGAGFNIFEIALLTSGLFSWSCLWCCLCLRGGRG